MDINKFILLLRKGVHPYEYMDEWKSLMRHYCLKKEYRRYYRFRL